MCACSRVCLLAGQSLAEGPAHVTKGMYSKVMIAACTQIRIQVNYKHKSCSQESKAKAVLHNALSPTVLTLELKPSIKAHKASHFEYMVVRLFLYLAGPVPRGCQAAICSGQYFQHHCARVASQAAYQPLPETKQSRT